MSSNEDDSICPLCKETTYVGETISCETCDLWFHFACVGVTHKDPVVKRQDLPFYCPKCDSRQKKKLPGSSSSSPKDGRRRKRDKEEEEWLDAVESGTLSEVVDPELKNIKDPKLMTARQRAMAKRQSKGISEFADESQGKAGEEDEEEEEEEEEEDDEEDESVKAMKALKSAKRKELEMEKREQDKKKTMDRLLKKRDSKTTRLMKSSRTGMSRGPSLMCYRMERDGSRTLTLAPGVEYPLTASSNELLLDIKVKLCQVCGIQPKAYSCSKTKIPLCSMQCYKANLTKYNAIE